MIVFFNTNVFVIVSGTFIVLKFEPLAVNNGVDFFPLETAEGRPPAWRKGPH